MLKVLPPNIANLIAAGEVVSRPASVVKELIENSIDAGADSVSVSVTDSGRTQIQIVDNGCGMSAEEAVLCFERHATSKISSAEDLEKIMTYGFRGEALASIAAVAHVTLRTKRRGDEVGTRVEAAQSQIVSAEPCQCADGCCLEVRDLFYNVPARRKFLKSDAVELRNIVQEFLRVALIRTAISLKLSSNGKELHNLRPVDNLKQRIRDIYGMNIAKEMVEVHVDTSVVKVRGFIGNPQDAHKRSGNQFFFVNGRYFRSPLLHKAVCRPYEKLIAPDAVPTYFLYLETAPENVDVNIHPAKTEVKFEDEGVVFEILMACVREALGKNDFTPSIDFDMRGAPEIPTFGAFGASGASGAAVASGGGAVAGGGFAPRGIVPPRIDFDPLFNPFEAPEGFVSEAPAPVSASAAGQPSLFGSSLTAAPQSKLLVLHGRFIVAPAKSGLMLIDISRARERIFYEQYYSLVAEGTPEVRSTLFPEKIELSREDYLTVLEQPDLLSQLGFDIRDFGGTSVVVYGVPQGVSLDGESIRESVDALIAALRDDVVVDDYRHLTAVRLARASAASARRREVGAEEAQMLVDKLFACREPNLSPEGHRCIAIIPIEELEKKL